MDLGVIPLKIYQVAGVEAPKFQILSLWIDCKVLGFSEYGLVFVDHVLCFAVTSR